MEKKVRSQYNIEWVKRKEEARLHNIALAQIGLRHIPIDKLLSYLQRRNMKRITNSGKY